MELLLLPIQNAFHALQTTNVDLRNRCHAAEMKVAQLANQAQCFKRLQGTLRRLADEMDEHVVDLDVDAANHPHDASSADELHAALVPAAAAPAASDDEVADEPHASTTDDSASTADDSASGDDEPTTAAAMPGDNASTADDSAGDDEPPTAASDQGLDIATRDRAPSPAQAPIASDIHHSIGLFYRSYNTQHSWEDYDRWYSILWAMPGGYFANVQVMLGPESDCRMYSKLELALKFVNMSPGVANRGQWWHALAYHLRGGQKVKVEGKLISRWKCCVGAFKTDPDNGMWWNALGKSLPSNQCVDVGVFGEVTKVDCHVRAIECDQPADPEYWADLGLTLGPDGSAEVRGDGVDSAPRSFCRMECYRKAIDSNCAWGWVFMGEALPDYKSTFEVNGIRYNMQECFLKALGVNVSCGRAWYSLGEQLSAYVSIVIDGVPFTKWDCYAKVVESVDHDNLHYAACDAILKMIIAPISGTSMASDIVIGRASLFCRSVCSKGMIQTLEIEDNEFSTFSIRKHQSNLWALAGKFYSVTKKDVIVHNRTYSERECYLKAIRIEPCC